MEPLDRGLNVAILHIASRLFPTGFDVAEDAPITYRDLCTHFEQSERITVYSGGCENTIYGDPEVNYTFRAWHDWCHWRGGRDFSVAGETAVWHMQCEHLVTLYDHTPITRRWTDILYAEVVVQRLYYEQHRTYLPDQRAFVRAYLEARAQVAAE